MRLSQHALALACIAFSPLARVETLYAEADNKDRVTVEVVDVAAGHAYVTPGESAGLRVGDVVKFGTHTYKVSAINARSAVLDLQGQSLRRGAHGSVRINPQQATGAARLDKPHDLGAFRGQWPNPTPPALAQHPKPVPLGPPQASGRAQAQLSLGAASSLPLAAPGSPWLRGDLRARVQAEPFRDLPLNVDADAALQLWAARGSGASASQASRPIWRVRALQLSYGRDSGLYAAAGRLRYAASTVGMLDGLKAQTPLGAGLMLAAYGGFVPDPLNGKPSSDATRFGAQLAWEDLVMSWRPRVALDAQGSRFAGALDERRLNANVDVFPGRSHAGAYASMSLFDRNNPWNAGAQELSAAGANFDARFGEFSVDGRVDMARPERSRWLASFLPPGFLCARGASSAQPAQDTCQSGEARYLAQADVALQRPNLALTLGGVASRTARTDSEQLAGFANASFLHVVDTLHIDGSLMGQTGSLLRSAAVSVGAGSLFAQDKLDVSFHYRPALSRYRADTATFLEHDFGLNLLLLLGAHTDLTFAADAIAGRDVSVVLLQTLLNWRPGV